MNSRLLISAFINLWFTYGIHHILVTCTSQAQCGRGHLIKHSKGENLLKIVKDVF